MIKIRKLQFELQNITFAKEQAHPNKMLWSGVVTLIDTPSTGVPGGSDAIFVFTKESIESSYQTLVGMPLNCVFDEDWFSNPAFTFTGHDTRNTIGYVMKAWIEDNKVMASGVIWKDSYADIAFMVTNIEKSLGFSVEADIKSELRADGNRYSKEVTFTGVAMLYKSCAAWEDTQLLSLVASKFKNTKDGVLMNKEETQAMIDTAMDGFMEKVTAAITAAVSGIEIPDNKETFEKLEAANTEMKAELDKIKATAVPAPSAAPAGGRAPAPKSDTADYQAELNKINAMNVSTEQKAKLRFQLAMKQENEKNQK